MSYQGYSIKIGGVTIPNRAIVPGSFSLTAEMRVKKKYQSGTGITKIKYYSANPMHTIKFTVKPGTAAEQATIRSALANKTERSVTYWDDDTGTYKTGNFWIKDVTWTHSYANAEAVYYEKTVVTLVEY